MSLVDISQFELHNMEMTPGGLRTRRGLVVVGSVGACVAGFSVESSSTTEVWHYTFQQAATGIVTLHVSTEEFVDMFTMDLGVMQPNPVITWGVIENQIMINSPSFSAPLYGLPGGGLITATKTASINPDTTALDIPAGHIAAFGDRFVIAQGNVIFFNDPPDGNHNDPRSFVGENAVALTGTVYDLFQGQDGALYMFTSAGAFSLPSDALGQGQQVVGSLSRIPGLETSRSRNAASSNGVIAVLQKDSIVLLPSGDRIDLSPKAVRRSTAIVTDVEDLRLFGQIFPTPHGFVVGFAGNRGFWLLINAATRAVTRWWSTTGDLPLRGVLRSRDEAPIFLTSSSALMAFARTASDTSNATIRCFALGRMPQPPGERPVLRHVTIQAENIGYFVGAVVNGTGKSVLTPTKTTDAIIGTSVWGASIKLRGRALRSMRMHFAERSAEPHVEIQINGGDFAVGNAALTEYGGQGAGRRDAG